MSASFILRNYKYVDVTVEEGETVSETFDFSNHSMMAIEPITTFVGNLTFSMNGKSVRNLSGDALSVTVSNLQVNPVPVEVAVLGSDVALVLETEAEDSYIFRIHMKG